MSSVSVVLLLIVPYIAALNVPAPPSSSVVLNCKGNGDVLTWLVKGFPLNETIERERAITSVSDTSNNNSIVLSTLTIKTIPANDGLELGCIVAYTDPYSLTLFQHYLLQIRGISPVEDLNLNFTLNNSLLISWSPPAYHSSDVTIEFYTYEVVVTYAEAFSLKDIAINTTALELANITMCDTFNVSVTALLSQYTSIASISHNGSGSSLNFTTKGCEIVFELISLPTCQFNLYVSNNNSILMQTLIAGYNPISYILLPHKNYQLFVQVENLKNEVQDELQTNISTYFVQDFDIAKNWDNGSVVIEFQGMTEPISCGYFMPLELHVVFAEKTHGPITFLNFTSEGMWLVTLSMSGNYSVSVFDIVNGSLFGPAFEFQGIQVDIPITEPVHSITHSMSVTPTITPTSAVSPKSSTLTIQAIVWSICFIVILTLVIYLSVAICYLRKSVIKSMCTTIKQRVLNKMSNLYDIAGLYKRKQGTTL